MSTSDNNSEKQSKNNVLFDFPGIFAQSGFLTRPIMVSL